MNGEKTVQTNSLKMLYSQQRMSVRSAIREELDDRGQNYQKLAHWLKKNDSELIKMPLVLKEIICKHIPSAEVLFKLPKLKKEASEMAGE